MAVFVKICGLTTPDIVSAAIEAGADALGFVFADSPRRVTVDRARDMTRNVPAHVIRVAVMRHPTQAEWDEVASGFRPDWLQTDAEDFARLSIGEDVVPMPVFRDSHSLDTGAVAAACHRPCSRRRSAAPGSRPTGNVLPNWRARPG